MNDLFDVDYVDLRPQQLAKGLSRWHVVTTGVEDDYRERLREIRRLHAADPWGGDTAGDNYRSAYFGDGGPDALMGLGEQLVAKVTALGPTVRRSAENARGMDARRAGEVRRLLRQI